MSSLKWKDAELIAFDTETSGKYPLESELCEIAAVKWRNGKIVDEYQSLIKPSHTMSDEVIKIHNITNEMVADAPSVSEVLPGFYDFFKDGYLIAHHAPFDLGFVAPELEKLGLPLPKNEVFCTSLLSRRIIPESPNHRLQTLITHLDLVRGQAHRALDDAKPCLEVFLECARREGEEVTLEALSHRQGGAIHWPRFSMEEVRGNSAHTALVEACEKGSKVSLVYQGGSRPGQERVVQAFGIVRSLNGDFFVAASEGDTQTKRFFLEKITASSL